MNALSRPRRWLKRVHPEGIPFPGTTLYDWISRRDVFQRHYDLLARDILRHISAGAVLDIGTGPGWLLLKLRERAPGLKLVGLDISPAMVERARKNLGPEIEVRQGNAAGLPFEAAAFDAIVSTGSVHHWKEPEACFREIHRVLKPGGLALIYDLVSDTPKPALRQMAKDFGRLHMVLLWVHSFEEPFYAEESFRALAPAALYDLVQAGFVGVVCGLVLRRRP